MSFVFVPLNVCDEEKGGGELILSGPAHSEHLTYLQHLDKEQAQRWAALSFCVLVYMYICSICVCVFYKFVSSLL